MSNKKVRDVQRIIRCWAIGIFSIVLPALILLHIYVDFNKYKFVESINSFLINLIPILFVTIFIQPITDFFLKIKNKEFENLLNEIKCSTNSIFAAMNTSEKHPEIENYVSSYQSIDWEKYLLDANKIDLSFLYSSSEWETKNRTAFEQFFAKSGTLNLFIPNVIDFTHKYFSEYGLKEEVKVKIYRTIRFFSEVKGKNGKLNIKLLNSGVNYVIIRIYRNDNSVCFWYSPYQNNFDQTSPPVIMINEANIQEKAMSDFIQREMNFLKESSFSIPNFEEERYITWDVEKNRVFISMSLTCNNKCKFCYVDSILEPHSIIPSIKNWGKLLASCVLNDDRFKKGKEGTNILLGGFSDPFSLYDQTILFLNECVKYENFIHIATRIGLGRNCRLHINDIFRNKNIIINYSLSTMNEKIEVMGNQKDRFEEAKKLIENGCKVALYLRPVLPEVTKKERFEILKLINYAGIKEIVVGGLYVDLKIKNLLKKVGVRCDGMSVLNKKFIFDNSDILSKLNVNNDIEFISLFFEENKISCFENSSNLIDFYKNKRVTT